MTITMENTVLLFIGNIGAAEILVLLVLFALPVLLWIWAAIDLLSSTFADNTNKIIWLIAIAFLPVIGAILYLIIGRRQKLKAPYGGDYSPR